METLTAVFEELDFKHVRTVLRSGNVVFGGTVTTVTAAAIEARLLRAIGVQSSVLIVPAEEFAAIATHNPLRASISDGAKGFITFLSAPPPPTVQRPSPGELSPELLAVSESALYQWIPGGLLGSTLNRGFWKQFAEPMTTRNLNTVGRICRLLDG